MRFGGFISEEFTSFGVEARFVSGEGSRKPGTGHFEGEKAVFLFGLPLGPEPIGTDCVLDDRLRGDLHRTGCGVLNGATALDIDANLHAASVKTPGPVELAVANEIVPFHADTISVKISVERFPFTADFRPDRCFVGFFGSRHRLTK